MVLREEFDESSVRRAAKASLSSESSEGTEAVAPSDSQTSDSQMPRAANRANQVSSSSKRKQKPLGLLRKEAVTEIVRAEMKNLNVSTSDPKRNSTLRISGGETQNSPVTLTGARSTMKPIVAAVPVESIRNFHNKRSRNVYGSPAITQVNISRENFELFVEQLKVYTCASVAAAGGLASGFGLRTNFSDGSWLATSLEAAVDYYVNHELVVDYDRLHRATEGVGTASRKVGAKISSAAKQLWLLVNFTRMHAQDGEFPDIIFHNHFSCGESAKGSEQIACTCTDEGIIVDLPLLAYLRTYTVLRSRDRNLMATCLARCKTYQREYSVSDHCMARVMPGTVMAAYIQSPEEGNALAMANSLQFEATTRQFGQTIRRSPYSGYLQAWWENGWSGLHSQWHGTVAVVGRQ